MKKLWATLATAAAAAATVLATAPPAGAAYPGTNGPIVSTWDGTIHSAPCLRPIGDVEDAWTVFITGDAAFSPSGRYLAYSGNSETLGNGLFVIDVRGCLTPRLIGPSAGGVAWSPDGRQLAVVRNNNIEIVDAASGVLVRRLTNSTAFKRNLSWRPGGGRIAYEVLEGGQPTIRTIPTTGGSTRFIARGSSPDYHPTNGRLAFVRPADERIVTVNGDTGGDLRVTPVAAAGPMTYSPDGRMFATSSVVDRESCITVTTGGTIRQRWGWAGCAVLAWGRSL